MHPTRTHSGRFVLLTTPSTLSPLTSDIRHHTSALSHLFRVLFTLLTLECAELRINCVTLQPNLRDCSRLVIDAIASCPSLNRSLANEFARTGGVSAMQRHTLTLVRELERAPLHSTCTVLAPNLNNRRF